MHTNQDLHIVKDFFSLTLAGNAAGAAALLDPNIEWIEPGAPDVPFGGDYKGMAGIGQMFAAEHKMVQLKSFNPKQYLAAENTIVVLGSDSATVLSTGKTYATDWTMVFTLSSGKITHVQTYMDTNAIAKAFLK